ncbi:MAG: acyl-CoA reductase [Acidobacteriota bacterium]
MHSTSPRHLRELFDRAAAARVDLAALSGERLAEVWSDAILALQTAMRGGDRALREGLLTSSGLSAAGLDAALDEMTGGVVTQASLAALRGAPRPHGKADGVDLLLLAATPPALVVQPLFDALLQRRPTLVRASRRAPHAAPALVAELAHREPILAKAFALVAWPAGAQEVEDLAFERAERIVAYGRARTLEALAARIRERLVARGPAMAVALLGPEIDPREVAPRLAREIALFDQRGCRCLQAIVTLGDGRALGRALRDALAERASAWPPGPATVELAGSLRRTRDVAILRGDDLWTVDGEPRDPGIERTGAPRLEDLARGTVILDAASSEEGPIDEARSDDRRSSPLALEASPGGRVVRIYTARRATGALQALEPWRALLSRVLVAGVRLPITSPLPLEELPTREERPRQ